MANPDDLALLRLKSLGIDVRMSVETCVPVCVETVLSTTKYSSIISYVEQQGGFFGLIYVLLFSPELSIQRVAKRVKGGGHRRRSTP